jgi:hypothetical protein
VVEWSIDVIVVLYALGNFLSFQSEVLFEVGFYNCADTSTYRIAFIIAFFLLLAGVALNDEHNEESYFSSGCSVKTGVFAGGVVLSLVAIALGIAYYIVSSSVKISAAWMHQNRGIDMTQPQYGPSNAEPVFVPENIYAQFHENPQYNNDLEQTAPPVGELQNSFWK